MNYILKNFKLKNYNFKFILAIISLLVIKIFIFSYVKGYSLISQIFMSIFAIIVMFIFSLIDYKKIFKNENYIYLFAILLLLLVLLIGTRINNSKRWINILIFNFQPSEICKILIILFFAKYFNKNRNHINDIRFIIKTFLLILLPILLIYKEPDLSTTIIYFIIFIVMFIFAGLSKTNITKLLIFGTSFLFIFLVLAFSFNNIFLKDYQKKRILEWLQMNNKNHMSLQQKNSIIAIGSGKFFGKLIEDKNSNLIKKVNIVSESHTDFIFSLIGEQLGFIFCIIIIFLLFYILYYIFTISNLISDFTSKLILIGINSWIGFQSIINIFVNIGLSPNTGVPLPFISHGGTSFLALFIAIGIVFNIIINNNINPYLKKYD